MPSIDEERMALACSRAEIGSRDAAWRGSRLIPRAIFFVLTIVCVVAFFGIIGLVQLPREIITAIVAIAVAEMLIVRGRLFHAGPEEALWIAGPLLLVFALPNPPQEESILLVGAAFLLAGLRVRNPLFIFVAVGLACVYPVVASRKSEPGALIALAIGFAALALARREWRDPLVEQLLALSIVGMPLLAWTLNATEDWRGGSWRAHLALAIGTAVIFTLVGILRRHRPALLGAVLCFAIALFEIDQRLTWPGELRFLFWGALVFIATLALVRLLRARRGGWTTEKIEEIEGFALVETAAVSAASPSAPDSPPEPIGQGGGFGGGGASGEF
jgi:hypothetical protein